MNNHQSNKNDIFSSIHINFGMCLPKVRNESMLLIQIEFILSVFVDPMRLLAW